MKRTLLFILLLAFFKISLAQNIKVSGTVTDSETREGVPGANIIIKGKLTGTVTNAAGYFELSTAAKPPLTLAISVVGYEKRSK